MAKYFTVIYGSELNGERTNEGDLIEYILQQEQLDAKECVMVGDREYDILGARRNAVASIAVSYGYGSAEEIQTAAPALVIDRFNDLISSIEQLQQQKVS